MNKTTFNIKKHLMTGVLVLLSGSAMAAGVPHTFVSGNTIKASEMNENFTAIENAISSGAGGFFIHWGSSLAAANSSLVYSGYGFASHYTHGGSLPPILIEGNMTTTTPGTTTGLLYPLVTSGTDLPPGISHSNIKGAMCTTDKPSTVIWGTQVAPTGTVELYKGYAMGAHYSHQGPGSLICVDSVNFETDANTPSAASLMYGIRISEAPAGSTGYLLDEHLGCVVVKPQ